MKSLYALYNFEKIKKVIKRVAIYGRKSRGELDEDLKKHLLLMREICEKYNWTYVEYNEIGSGDSIEDRVKIKELLQDVKEGLYDAVMVMDFDRLGRGSGTDQDTILRTFKISDTLIITANPFQILDPNDERDEETMEFKGFLARREYKMITKRLSTGKKLGLRLGRWSNGPAPFGYVYNPELKKLVPHPENAEIYRKLIVEEFLNGKSTYDIAWKLNQMKIPSPRNGLWSPNTVNRLLKSEVHLGHIVSNKTEGVRSDSPNKKPFKKKPKEEWITVKNCHMPLKTEEEHMKILHIMESKKSHTNGGNINPLSGLVKCFNCGKTLTIQKEENGTFLKKCQNCGKTKGGDIELVTEAIFDTVHLLKNHLAKINAEEVNNIEKENILKKIQKLEEEYERHERAIERIEEAYENGLYSIEKVRKKTKERQERLLEIEEKLREEKKKLEAFSIVGNEERIKRIDNFLKEIKNTTDGRKLNMIYKSIIDNIIWKRTDLYEVKITVNFL